MANFVNDSSIRTYCDIKKDALGDKFEILLVEILGDGAQETDHRLGKDVDDLHHLGKLRLKQQDLLDIYR